MQLKQTAQTLLTDVKHYWKKPPAGRYMPFKEIAAYSVGGIGAYFIITVTFHGHFPILGTSKKPYLQLPPEHMKATDKK